MEVMTAPLFTDASRAPRDGNFARRVRYSHINGANGGTASQPAFSFSRALEVMCS